MKETFILVTDVCKKRNCFHDHTEDGRHKIKVSVECGESR